MPIIGIVILSAAGCFLLYALSRFFMETMKLRRQSRRVRGYTIAFPRKVVTENKVRLITAHRRGNAHHSGTRDPQRSDGIESAALPAGVHRLAPVRRIRS